MSDQKRLHIGSGKCYLPGWINVDLFDTVKADIYADMAALPFPRETFDLIYCSHVLEHANRRTIPAILTHWHDLLKPNGILRLAVPDFAACVKWYNATGELDPLLGLLYGGQNFPRNHHFVIFDETTLAAYLISVGFRNVERWDWKKTDHAHFDDYSKAYLPHMDKDNGLLMSLNLQASK